METIIPFEDNQKLVEDAAIGYFSAPHVLPELMLFRGLCNGIKACAIEAAVKAVREERVPTLGVLDLGSGRGGDLAKLGRYRLRSYLGVDGCASSVLEARERHKRLITNGRSALPARFEALDFRKESFPLDDGCTDIVTCQFALQFAFDAVASVRHLIAEVMRVLRPGGVFVGVFPDGDRIASLLSSSDASTIRFGHFRFGKFEGTKAALQNDPPANVPYTFYLGDNEGCPEYVVSPSYLHEMLDSNDFEPILSEHSLAAHDFYLALPENKKIVSAVMRKSGCSHDDWVTLGAFRVLLCRKKRVSVKRRRVSKLP